MIDIKPTLEKLGLNEPPCPIYWTNKNLHFWELGAFFDDGTKQWIELNPKNHFFFLGYNHQKVLEHELIHALRASYKDSIWEELLAYQVSKYGYQRFLGPFLSQKLVSILLLITPFVIRWDIKFFALLWAFLGMKYLRQYLSFKTALNHFQKEGFSKQASWLKLVHLSPEDLGKLSTKKELL